MNKSPLVLTHRLAHTANATRSFISALFLAAAFLVIAGVVFYLHGHPAPGMPAHSDEFIEFQYLMALIGSLVLAAILLAILLASFLVFKRQSVRIDDLGIQFDNGGSWRGLLFGKSWMLRWDEIQQISWRDNLQQPRATRLAIQTPEGVRQLMPWQWLDPNLPVPQAPFSLGRTTIEKIRPMLAHMPVVEALNAHRPYLISPITTDKMTTNRGITGATPMTVLIAATMGLGVLYFITEIYFTLSECYVGSPPWGLLIAMVAVSGAVIYPLLRYVELKRTDSVVYALLFAVAIGFIAYPLSIRVNIWTASQPEVSSAYQLGGDYIWHPKDDKTLPALPIYLKSSRW